MQNALWERKCIVWMPTFVNAPSCLPGQKSSHVVTLSMVIGAPSKVFEIRKNYPHAAAPDRYEFSYVLPTERRSLLCLNYLTFGTVHRRAAGGRGASQALLRHSDSGWWQKPREDAAEKRLPAIMAEMTAAVMKGWGGGRQNPQRGAEERERASFRENSPQAHMVGLKHPNPCLKQKIFSMLSLLLSCSCALETLFTGRFIFIFHCAWQPQRNTDEGGGSI